LIEHELERAVRDRGERLGDGRERRVAEPRQQQIVEPHHAEVPRRPEAAGTNHLDRAERHRVVGGDDAVEGHAGVEEPLHGGLAGLVHEGPRRHQRGVEGQPMALERVVVGAQPTLRFGVLERAADEQQTPAAVLLDQVVDHGFHAALVVDEDARHPLDRDADAARRQAAVALEESPHPFRPAVGAERGGDRDDAVDGARADEIEDRVVRRAPRVRLFHGSPEDDEQVEVELRAPCVEGTADLALEAAREEVDEVEQQRDGGAFASGGESVPRSSLSRGPRRPW